MEQATPTKRRTPYEMVGGTPAVRRVVDRFYDLMEADAGFAELRALHAADLSPMRDSLTGFLIAWLGGPRDWFEAQPGRCVMSAHRDVRIDRQTAQQWADAMERAVADCVEDAELAHKMGQALAGMAMGMAGVPAH